MKKLCLLFAMITSAACTQLETTSGGMSLCEKAAAHVAECTGEIASANVSGCDEYRAAAVAALTCDEIINGPGDDALADTIAADKGESCNFNAQCSGNDGTCRPSGAKTDVCLKKARNGRLCNVGFVLNDCADPDASCERVDESLRKGVGICRKSRD